MCDTISYWTTPWLLHKHQYVRIDSFLVLHCLLTQCLIVDCEDFHGISGFIPVRTPSPLCLFAEPIRGAWWSRDSGFAFRLSAKQGGRPGCIQARLQHRLYPGWNKSHWHFYMGKRLSAGSAPATITHRGNYLGTNHEPSHNKQKKTWVNPLKCSSHSCSGITKRDLLIF